MKILIADDSKTSLLMLTNALKKMKHTVIATSEAHEILDLYKSNSPDLIILDVVLDDNLDGFEIAKKIREIEEDWVPIIFLSAKVDDEYISKGVDAGGDDYLLKPCSDITILAKIKAMKRIAKMRSKLIDMSKKLKELSTYDTLTSIPNRLYFEEKIQSAISNAQINNTEMALLFIDLDNFKYVNDNMGHDAGDKLLKIVSEHFQNTLNNAASEENQNPINSTNFLARMGGDEFAVILENISSYQDAGKIAGQLINCISTPIIINGENTGVGCSIGIACYPHAGTDMKSLIKKADIAMYNAKNAGRNDFKFYSNVLNESFSRDMLILDEIKLALDRKEIYLMYQNICNIRDGTVSGIEVYCRWNNERLGNIETIKLLNRAEDLKILNSIESFVLDKAIEQFVSWQESNSGMFYCHLNISQQQLKNPEFLNKIISYQHNNKNIQICLDVPQKVLNSDLDDIIKHLINLSKNNIDLYIDDFCDPSCNLLKVSQIRFKGVKIKYSYLEEMYKDNLDSSLTNILQIIKALKLQTVIKSVESREILNILTSSGFEHAQGHAIHSPEKAGDITF